MKTSLFVVNIDYYPEIVRQTMPGLRRYAEFIRATFVEIKERKFPDRHVAYEKMQVYELGCDNDWNVLMDLDIVVKFGMYNVIDMVPEDGQHVGVWQSYWERNLYNGRGIDVALAGNFIVAPASCHEIFKPLDKDEQPEKWLRNMKSIDEYCLSLNRQRMGYKLAGLEIPGAYGTLFEHLNATTTKGDL